MTIDADVLTTAKKWGLDPRFLQAVCNAEGSDPQAIVRAVNCTPGVNAQTRQDALNVLARSATHAMRDFLTEYGFNATFVSYFGNRWAPPNAGNDPNGLNTHWIPNVQKLWLGSTK